MARLSCTLLVLLWFCRGAGALQVNITHDLDYVPGVDYAHGKDRLDIYSPAGASAEPVVVMFHGGGLVEGDRKDERSFAEALATAGYVVVAPSYRLTPSVVHPAHAEDAAAAVAWTRRNAAGWGGDPRRVFVAGYSAGAYLAALIGTDSRYLAAHGVHTGDLAGLVLIAGTFDLRNRPADTLAPWGADPGVLTTASPVRYVGPHVPRVLLIVGDRDEAWRVRDHRVAAAALAAASPRGATLRVVPGRDHTTIRRRPGEQHAPELLAAILEFLRIP